MVYCAVYGCKSSNKNSEKIDFHKFPGNTAEAAKWLQFCRRADAVNLKNAAICGLHFKPSDYRRNLRHELLNPGQPECRPKLKKGAVPSVELPKCNLGTEADTRIRKKYLYGDTCNMQIQHGEKRCKECGSTYEHSPPSVSPLFSESIKFENKEYNKILPTLKLEMLDGHLESSDMYDILSEESESITDINYEYPTVCLVCDAVIKDSATVGLPDLFLESSVTSHTRQQAVVMLAVLIDTPLNSEKAYSKSLCQRCFRLLNELDEVQYRTATIKSNIEGLYNQSLQKRNMMHQNTAVDSTELLVESSAISVHDHQYIKNSEELKEKDKQPILNLDSLRSRDHSSGLFDRYQWRKDEAVRDAWRRGKDPLYREEVRKGWRERKAKQRMKGLDRMEKQMLLKSEEHTFSELEEVLSSFVDDQAENGTHSVIQINSSEAANDQIYLDETMEVEKIPVNDPKPIVIKVCKSGSQMDPVIDGLPMIKDRVKPPPVRRQYKRRSHIIHLCKFCSEVFETGDELKMHQKTHTTIECKFCGKILVRIGAWETHLRTFHNVKIQSNDNSIEEMLTCNTCSKQFTSKSALRYHLKLHDGKIYTCDKCSKEFNHPGTFKNHLLIHEDRKYMCDKCGKGFRTNFHLIMHDNQTHRKARSWKCKYCDKAFARCATFREHVRSHNVERTDHLSLLQEVDVSHSVADMKDDLESINLKPEQSLNENDNDLFSVGCEMLSIEEDVDNEEARIVIDENQATCEEQNLVINSEAELYVEEFVINDENIMINSL